MEGAVLSFSSWRRGGLILRGKGGVKESARAIKRLLRKRFFSLCRTFKTEKINSSGAARKERVVEEVGEGKTKGVASALPRVEEHRVRKEAENKKRVLGSKPHQQVRDKEEKVFTILRKKRGVSKEGGT